MTPVTEPTMQLLTGRRRRKKFTPERIEQIKNLLERGKGRQEIAESLDVTVGSLQVTCSRLGISLRRVKSRPPASRTQTEIPDAIEASFAIRIQYKGEERTTELPFTNSIINRLALEAEFRGIRICELVSELLIKTIKNDLPGALSSSAMSLRARNGSQTDLDSIFRSNMPWSDIPRISLVKGEAEPW